MAPRGPSALAILLPLSAVLLPAAHGATHRVPQDRPTLTAAVRAAAPGDEIVLAPGRYTPATGERFPIRLAGKSVRIAGAGAERTVLDAAGRSRHFLFEEDDASTIADLQLTDGHAADGGGSVRSGSRVGPAFVRVIFRGNAAARDGDAVLVEDGAARFSSCLFETNDGAGPTVCVRAGSPAFTACTWGGNAGAAVEVRGRARPGITACVIAHPGRHGGARLGIRIVAEPEAEGPRLSDNAFAGCDDGVVRVEGEAGLALAAAIDTARRTRGLRRATGGVRDPERGDWRLGGDDPDAQRLGAFADRDGLPPPRPSAPGGDAAEPVLLGPSAPNPLAPFTTIPFRVPEPSLVDLGVYNVVGERVRTLPAGDLPAGDHERVWDGRDDRGEELPPGIYFVRITIGTVMESRRVVLVR